MSNYGRNKNFVKNNDKNEDESFSKFPVRIPNSTYAMLKALKTARGESISRMVALLIDKELDKDINECFTYPCELPSNDFIEYAYTEEAAKVARFLASFKIGTSIETIVLCRREIGVPDRDDLLAGLRELLERNMVNTVQPSPALRSRLGYKDDKVFYKVVGAGKRPSEKDIIRRKEKARKDIEKAEREIKEMERYE